MTAWPHGTGLLRLDEIDSTNCEARRRAEAGDAEHGPLWITAVRQTAGRGRRGRVWQGGAGNLAATLLDSAMGLAVHSMLPPGTGYTTLEFKISFVRGMTKDTGPVRSEGRILNVGRRAATAEARITDGKGRLLAHATTTCLVFEIPTGAAGT